MSPTSLQAGTGPVKSRRTRSGRGFALGSGIVARFRALGAHPRIPGSRINLRALYRVRPENSPGRKRFTNRKPNLRSGSGHTRRTASRSSRSSAFGSGPPASSRRRFCTHLFTVLEFRPSSAQHSVIGLPVEMMWSAVSRLNSSVCLAAGFGKAYRPLGRR